MSKVIVDAFGGDNAPLCCIQGAVMARQKWGMEIALAGEEDVILAFGSLSFIGLLTSCVEKEKY